MIIVFLFPSLAAIASESREAFEKSFPRDNTFCSFRDKRIELLIRGGQKFTEPKERGYGELIFYRQKGQKPSLLPLSSSRSDTFKLFLGSSPFCSKSHGYQLDDSTLAVLLLKENRPFKDKLVIQFFDLKSLTPKDFLETPYPTDKAIRTPNGFAFRTFHENHDRDYGKVSIEGESYIYQEREFPQWMNYSRKGFEVLPQLTFKRFPWKKSFKDEQDFHIATGWDPAAGKFIKTTIYMAVSQKLKKKCLLFIEKKQRPAGNEAWRCQTI